MLKRIGENKKGFVVILIAILSLFFIGSFSVIAHASSFIVDSVIDGKIFEYNRYPLENYTLDFYYDAGSAFLPWNWGDNAVKLLGTALNILTNVILSLTNLMCYFVGYIVEQAFSLDFVTDILSSIKPMIQSVIGFNESGLMSNGILSGFIMLLITILGCYLVYVGLLKREVTKAVSTILTFITVMFAMVAYSLFADKYLIKLNDFSKEVSSNMLNIGNNVGVSEDEPVSNETVVAGIRDRLFQIQIQKPYLLLQYGTSNINEINESDPNRISSILKYDSASKEREEVVKKEVQNGNKNMGISGLGSRLGNVMLMFFLNLILSIVILLFAGAMLYYQLLFLFYAIVLPINFLVGLVPSFSNNGVKGITNLLGSVLKRQGLCLIVSLVFTISNFIYDVTDESKYGFLFVFSIQLLLFYVAYKKSHEVLSLFDFVGGNDKMHIPRSNIINNMRYRMGLNRLMNRGNRNNSESNRNNKSDNEKSSENRDLVNNTKNKYRSTSSKNNENSNMLKDRSIMSGAGAKVGNVMSMKDKIGAKKDSIGNKIRTMPRDVKGNIKNKMGSLKDFKESYEDTKMYNGAKRNLYKRRMEKDNKEKKENSKDNLNKKDNLVKREPIDMKHYDSGKPTVLKVGENKVDKNNDKRNIVLNSNTKSLRKRDNVNEKKKGKKQ